jgi:hypothetical protein
MVQRRLALAVRVVQRPGDRRPEVKSRSIEQALFGNRPGHPGCLKVRHDFAGLKVAQLRVFDPVALLTVTIESKSIFDIPNMFSIFIKVTRHLLPLMLPLCRPRLQPPILIDHPALSPFFVVWRRPESDWRRVLEDRPSLRQTRLRETNLSTGKKRFSISDRIDHCSSRAERRSCGGGWL